MTSRTSRSTSRRGRPSSEHSLVQRLKQRHWIALHGWLIGLFVMLVMWAVSRFQWMLNAEASLALRYLVTLGSGYLVYLLVLHEWGRWILRRQASGDEGESALGEAATDVAMEVTTEVAGRTVAGAFEVAVSAEEGAIVAVPLVAIFVVAVALLTGLGAMLWLYFGAEVLLTVAVELAFSVASARAVMRAEREGWLACAVRLTWKPLLGALVCAVALGAVLDHFVPEAQSLRQAVQVLRGQ